MPTEILLLVACGFWAKNLRKYNHEKTLTFYDFKEFIREGETK
jgi:hypothetical protein